MDNGHRQRKRGRPRDTKLAQTPRSHRASLLCESQLQPTGPVAIIPVGNDVGGGGGGGGGNDDDATNNNSDVSCSDQKTSVESALLSASRVHHLARGRPTLEYSAANAAIAGGSYFSFSLADARSAGGPCRDRPLISK